MIHNYHMSRMKRVPDSEVLYSVLQRMLSDGEAAATFSAIATATGLSAPALVLRFGTKAQMCQLALRDGWAELTRRAEAGLTLGKGVQSFLKSQSDYVDIPALLALSQGDPATRAAASLWRETIETALSRHFGGGLKGRNAAGLVFAAWQGRLAWAETGGKSFRLGEVIRGLS